MGCAWSSCCGGVESSTTFGGAGRRRGLRPVARSLERREAGPIAAGTPGSVEATSTGAGAVTVGLPGASPDRGISVLGHRGQRRNDLHTCGHPMGGLSCIGGWAGSGELPSASMQCDPQRLGRQDRLREPRGDESLRSGHLGEFRCSVPTRRPMSPGRDASTV